MVMGEISVIKTQYASTWRTSPSGVPVSNVDSYNFNERQNSWSKVNSLKVFATVAFMTSRGSTCMNLTLCQEHPEVSNVMMCYTVHHYEILIFFPATPPRSLIEGLAFRRLVLPTCIVVRGSVRHANSQGAGK